MLKSVLVTFIIVLCGCGVMAQKKEDIAAIKKLCGCFAVTFNYAETFTNDTVKKRYAHPLDNFAVTEYAYPIEERRNKIVIQHLLVIPDEKGTVIKHWREDWQYEQREIWQYTNAREWTKVNRPLSDVKGQWTQSVWEVSDAPRYTGTSEWVQVNKENLWTSTTDAPLPRREYTTRHDYNVLNRTNRMHVTEAGYLHEQDNKKIIRKAGIADSVLAEEKGYNKYVRLPESSCAQAKAFWTAARAGYWKDVRLTWTEKMNTSEKITLLSKVDGNYLFEKLDELSARQMSASERTTSIRELLTRYMQNAAVDGDASH